MNRRITPSQTTSSAASSNASRKPTPEASHTERPKSLAAPRLELTTRQIEELREAFNIFDSEGTGFVSVNDFKIAMKALGFEPDTKELQRLLFGEENPFAREKPDGITFQEFQNILGQKMNRVDTEADLERAFELFDDDETGFISLKNLKRIARQLGEEDGEEELQAMLDAADRRGVGEVTLEDFKRVMSKAAWAK